MRKSKGYAIGQTAMRARNWCNSCTMGGVETAHADAFSATRLKLVHRAAAWRMQWCLRSLTMIGALLPSEAAVLMTALRATARS
jgi:hypothetical protein